VTALRWILVPVTAFSVWAALLLTGLMGVDVLDSLCPPDLMISGLCTAWWHRPAITGLEMICAGLAAAGFVALPARVAPAHRVNVALVCFVLGALFTVELASSGQMWAPSAVAALVGVMTLRRTIRQTRVN
jgi:hypothetical protein